MSIYRLERTNDVDGLTDAVVESDSPAVRRRAAAALGSVDDGEAAVEVLADVADEDGDEQVRAAAIDALDRLGDEAIGRYLADSVASTDGADWARSQALADALDESVPELRMAAVTLLGRVGDPTVVPSVVDCLSDEDRRVRVRAARACGRLADPRAIEGLTARTDDAATAVRREVAQALGDIGGSTAATALRDLLEDPDADVRRAAVAGLGEAGAPAAVTTVAAALGDDSERVRSAAVYALLSLLAAAPAERSHEVRDEVLGELRAATGDVVVDALAEVLEESQQTTHRRNAAWLLGRVVDGRRPDAAAALVDTLADDDPTTAKMAATSLTEVDDPEVERQLVDLLEDGSRPALARAHAAFVLGRVGGEPARRALDAIVDETDAEQVRRRAFTALSRLGGR